MSEPYRIDRSSNSRRRAVEEWLWGLDLVSPETRDRIVTAWVSSWASSSHDRLEDMPFTFGGEFYPLMQHVNEVTRAGVDLARRAAADWGKPLDWKNQTLTPNPDVIYVMPFFNTKDVGPMVLEVPPADDGVLNGSIMNCWQAAIEDIGPGGVDKGKGGKYLILPPDFPADQVPAGYIPMHSDTFQGYALIRSVLASGRDADVAKAIAYSKRLRLYPLSAAANRPGCGPSVV